jgi:hypothetical protein
MLQLEDRSTVTLINGVQLTRVKALDRASGDIVGATFDGANVVDEPTLRSRVATEWRAAHGALTYDLVNKLAGLMPDDKLDIGVWLKADIVSLPRPAQPVLSNGSSSSSGGPGDSAQPFISQQAVAQLSVDGKPIAQPIIESDIPADVRAHLQTAIEEQDATPKGQAVQSEKGTPGKPALVAAPSTQQLQAADAFRQQNISYLQAQVAPIEAQFARLMSQRGLSVTSANSTAPIAFLNGVTRQQIEELAFLPQVDTVYDVSLAGGPALGIARPAQNADLLETQGGYTGSGTKVAVVEGGRVFTLNPYLAVAGYRDGSRAAAAHSTAVGGMIASTHSTVRGLAPGVSLYTANGDDYETAQALADAMDWGSTNATVLNNSFYVEDEGTTDAPLLFDRHMDYIVRYNYDFAVVAAGNFGAAGCQYSGSVRRSYVTTPGKGYNALTVGNYDDHDTLNWNDDTMASCSSYNLSGRWKPEVAATGTDISSTLTSSPWIGAVGSGTSYASPMVAALAADLIQIQPTLVDKPEVLRSLIMATALHNIEGDARLSRQDGVGGMDASAAAVAAENAWFDDRMITSTTPYPITFNVYAWKGEHVRFVINWLSNPTANYSSDPQSIDLDLTAYRADGTTIIQSSTNSTSNFEIVDFAAPADETYHFRVTQYDGSLTSPTWLGTAWMRSPYRIHPDVGYHDSTAAPMGTSLAVLPSDWPTSNYWHVMGIRPDSTADYDLQLNSASIFDNPSTRTSKVSSAYVTGLPDYIMVDGNHQMVTTTLQFLVTKFAGTGGYATNWSDLGAALNYPGWYGPFTMDSSEVAKSFDLWVNPNKAKRIYLVPATSSIDYELNLFKSNPANASTWARSRSGFTKHADTYGVGNAVESLQYLNNTASGDWVGLAVASKTAAAGSFYLYVQDVGAWLPYVRR